MPFEYLEDAVTSDVGFHAWGRTLEELLVAAIDATTNVMVSDLSTLRPDRHVEVRIAAEELDILLRRVLEEVIFRKDAEGVLLRASEVGIERGPEGHRAHLRLAGEPIDTARHDLGSDVKAVTLHGLRVELQGCQWHAWATLDV